MEETVLQRKSLVFALNIVRFTVELKDVKRQYVLGDQLLRSGTSIGAMIREAKFAESDADYIHKFKIALKEANETYYWLEILRLSDLGDLKATETLTAEVNELIAMLVSSVKTLKVKQEAKKNPVKNSVLLF